MVRAKLGIIGLVFGVMVGCADLPSQTPPIDGGRAPAVSQQNNADQVSFFSTPEDMHGTWVKAINGAQSSIFMEMFHLTDPDIVKALKTAAKKPGMDITLILDSVNLKEPGTLKVEKQILSGNPPPKNIHVYPSSGPPSGFVQTHTKAMIIDGSVALITSINLTTMASVQRDYGIETTDEEIIGEMTAVFNDDIKNSQNAQNNQLPVKDTPPNVGLGKIIWSPNDQGNSENRLVSLIGEASKIPSGPSKFLFATVENLGDLRIEEALSTAAQNGVNVQIIVPQCVLGANGNRNYKYFDTLKNGVHYRVMPHPSTPLDPQNPQNPYSPYMHGKMIVLGSGRAYVGSINYSANSTQDNRELGIIFTNSDVSKQIANIFSKDFQQAQDVPAGTTPPTCPTGTTDPSK